jgi:hypothetical protein
MTFILIAIIAMALVVIFWTWHNLGTEIVSKKIVWILAGGLTCYGITFLLMQFSQAGVYYPNQEARNQILGVLVSLFTVLNSGIILPYLAKLWDGLKEEEITKQVVKRKMVILMILLVIVFWIEVTYLTSIQEGIIQVYENQKQIR